MSWSPSGGALGPGQQETSGQRGECWVRPCLYSTSVEDSRLVLLLCQKTWWCGANQRKGSWSAVTQTHPQASRRAARCPLRAPVPMCFSLAAGAQAERKDGSHPVHVDNCVLNAEALVCIKEPPAYTFRDFRCQRSSGPRGPMPCSLLQHMHTWDQLLPESLNPESLGWKSNNTGMVTVYWENKMEKGGRGAEIAQRRAWWVLRLRVGRREDQESCL